MLREGSHGVPKARCTSPRRAAPPSTAPAPPWRAARTATAARAPSRGSGEASRSGWRPVCPPPSILRSPTSSARTTCRSSVEATWRSRSGGAPLPPPAPDSERWAASSEGRRKATEAVIRASGHRPAREPLGERSRPEVVALADVRSRAPRHRRTSRSDRRRGRTLLGGETDHLDADGWRDLLGSRRTSARASSRNGNGNRLTRRMRRATTRARSAAHGSLRRTIKEFEGVDGEERCARAWRSTRRAVLRVLRHAPRSPRRSVVP